MLEDKNNKVYIIINDYGNDLDMNGNIYDDSDYDYFFGRKEVLSHYKEQKFECIQAFEKILAYAECESENVISLLLNAYYEACKVAEKLSKGRNNKYKMPREFHEWQNIISMRLEIVEKDFIKVIAVSSYEVGYEYSSLFASLGDCLYKMLNRLYDENLIEISKRGSIPYKKYKYRDKSKEIVEWRLDKDLNFMKTKR
ncbi:hypothetical protein [Terrisporobacter petrolearius]|uniref:hypothetical protein n=1 Tax=Terrisporobacter petrolearius TaxID=1460447 RepID=UPI0022E81C55|nr:hypothetical protein [Terrisporobacter petrolearius]